MTIDSYLAHAAPIISAFLGAPPGHLNPLTTAGMLAVGVVLLWFGAMVGSRAFATGTMGANGLLAVAWAGLAIGLDVVGLAFPLTAEQRWAAVGVTFVLMVGAAQVLLETHVPRAIGAVVLGWGFAALAAELVGRMIWLTLAI